MSRTIPFQVDRRFNDFGTIPLEEFEKLALFRFPDAVLLQRFDGVLAVAEGTLSRQSIQNH